MLGVIEADKQCSRDVSLHEYLVVVHLGGLVSLVEAQF